ncbi:MAG: 6-bladed beta-propeller [Gemmatimonadetes bacterium]|nr:6-bladed beta-propeller [Gemmatimonadota bacterium]
MARPRVARPAWARATSALLVCAASLAIASPAATQSSRYRQVDAPQPPPELNGGRWGEMIQVRVGPQDHVYVLHRCFKVVLGDPGVAPGHSDGLTADCLGRWAVHPPILEFDASGAFVGSYGTGLVGRPHGFAVDHEGNMWVTDAALVPGEMGSVVIKLSPAGELLMTLGTQGVTGRGTDTFDRPSGVAVAPTGEIFVTDGEASNDRIVKFSSEGRYLTEWGTSGSGPGQFDNPHDIVIDARGRVFVADRGNGRIQIFDANGRFLDQWTGFGRPSGIFLNRQTDVLYSTDSQSNSGNNPGVRRGIYVGSALTGEVTDFIPDPDIDLADRTRISGASGIAANSTDTVIYAADVAPYQLRVYMRR